jgi:hypothetical protein
MTVKFAEKLSVNICDVKLFVSIGNLELKTDRKSKKLNSNSLELWATDL